VLSQQARAVDGLSHEWADVAGGLRRNQRAASFDTFGFGTYVTYQVHARPLVWNLCEVYYPYCAEEYSDVHRYRRCLRPSGRTPV
jgi:hypothetical protein